jgi:hypothetical protein
VAAAATKPGVAVRETWTTGAKLVAVAATNPGVGVEDALTTGGKLVAVAATNPGVGLPVARTVGAKREVVTETNPSAGVAEVLTVGAKDVAGAATKLGVTVVPVTLSSSVRLSTYVVREAASAPLKLRTRKPPAVTMRAAFVSEKVAVVVVPSPSVPVHVEKVSATLAPDPMAWKRKKLTVPATSVFATEARLVWAPATYR